MASVSYHLFVPLEVKKPEQRARFRQLCKSYAERSAKTPKRGAGCASSAFVATTDEGVVMLDRLTIDTLSHTPHRHDLATATEIVSQLSQYTACSRGMLTKGVTFTLFSLFSER